MPDTIDMLAYVPLFALLDDAECAAAGRKKSTGGLDETDLSQHTLDPSVRLRGAIADGRNGIAVHGAGK